MKILLRTFLSIILLFSYAAVSQAGNNNHPTIKDLMNIIHEHYGVNFIYDSSIELDTPAENNINPSRQDLEECLTILFEGTDLAWEVMKKYIVITYSDKKPKDYTALILRR